ncbi:hypothetical protein GOODEAATRI_002825 [Goodea atripinnis]|uniref:Uncharacterized protein n=1 Tax=Goodea atripinnis TaxID=208336 RepID=A0ABV0NRC4_9TELE
MLIPGYNGICSDFYGLMTHPRLLGSNHCFSKIIAEVFPAWHCVKTHMYVPDQQFAKNFCLFRGIHTCQWSANQVHSFVAPGCFLCNILWKQKGCTFFGS